MAKYNINRKQGNRLASIAADHGMVAVTYQLEDGSLVVTYGKRVLRALIDTEGNLDVTDTKETAARR